MKEIKDCPGYYVTEDGRVWSAKRNVWKTIRYDWDGYAQVLCYVNGKIVAKMLAKAVIEAYGPAKPGPEYEIDHIDRNRINNHIDNLRWVTKAEQRANRGPYKKYNTNPIEVYKDGAYVGTYKTLRETSSITGLRERHIVYHIEKNTPDRNGYTYRRIGG